MNRREIHALVENPCLGRRIAEENDRDGGAILQHRAEGRTDADWDGAPDNRDAAEEVDRQVDEVHRAALARRAPVYFAIQFREHGPQAAALADVMRMRAVRADDVVFLAQVPAHPGRHRLLTDAEMSRTAHIAFRIERLDALLHPPNLQHGTIHS